MYLNIRNFNHKLLLLIITLFLSGSFNNILIAKNNEYKIDNNKLIKTTVDSFQIKKIYAVENDNGYFNNKDYKGDTQKSEKISITTANIKTSNKSNFNFVAVGDWDCTRETEDTVDNIIDKSPELVLALGDLSYDNSAKCWLEIIEPIADRTKIALGNHESESSKKLKDYMKFFGLEKQYYSFNYVNVHFLALSTEVPYDFDSQQYKFAISDLKKYSTEQSIDYIIVFYHRQLYSSGGGPEDEEDFREIYHPLFDKFDVDLALQGHVHAYERLYPITFNEDDDEEPLVQDNNTNTYRNPNGTIFVTVGTGGADYMELSKSKPFSAIDLEGEYGILNISIENNNNGTTLSGTFIENENDQDIYDHFTIIKDRN